MSEPVVLREVGEDGVAVITLNRPQAMNALSRELLDELARTIDALASDPAVRVLILTGAGRAFCAGLDLSELVAIGNEGLLKAVKKFDPDQGVKFISYAVWWVRQAVLKALAEQTRSVRIPLNQNSQLIKMSRTETYLSQELGREPTDDEIALALEDSVENVRTARRMTAAELSLDAPVDRSDKDAATLGERFAGQEGGEIEERTDGRLMREFVDRIFQKYLTPRERKILYLYYGLEEGSEAMTLEKIGALMGVTRERIRQIRERAFEKLRESPDGRALCGFWAA